MTSAKTITQSTVVLVNALSLLAFVGRETFIDAALYGTRCMIEIVGNNYHNYFFSNFLELQESDKLSQIKYSANW